MSDISKCLGEECTIKRTCYRFKAPGNEYQWYLEPPKKGPGCAEYIHVKEKSEEHDDKS